MAYLHHASQEYVDEKVQTETGARTLAINTAKSQLQALIQSETSRASGQEAILQQAINNIQTFEVVIADTLPEPSELCAKKIYFVPSANPKATNTKDEYICVQQSNTWKWEQIGSTAITIEYDTKPTDGSSKHVRSGGIYAWVKEEIGTITSWAIDKFDEIVDAITGKLDKTDVVAPTGSTAISTSKAAQAEATRLALNGKLDGPTVAPSNDASKSGKAADALATGNALAGKVEAVPNKGLSTNDYTNEDKAEVAKVKDKLDKTSVVPASPSASPGAAAEAKTARHLTERRVFKDDFTAWVKTDYDPEEQDPVPQDAEIRWDEDAGKWGLFLNGYYQQYPVPGDPDASDPNATHLYFERSYGNYWFVADREPAIVPDGDKTLVDSAQLATKRPLTDNECHVTEMTPWVCNRAGVDVSKLHWGLVPPTTDYYAWLWGDAEDDLSGDYYTHEIRWDYQVIVDRFLGEGVAVAPVIFTRAATCTEGEKFMTPSRVFDSDGKPNDQFATDLLGKQVAKEAIAYKVATTAGENRSVLVVEIAETATAAVNVVVPAPVANKVIDFEVWVKVAARSTDIPQINYGYMVDETFTPVMLIKKGGENPAYEKDASATVTNIVHFTSSDASGYTVVAAAFK